MPIFEYKCNKCNSMFEQLQKSTKRNDDVICPSCNSNDIIKLISAFNSLKSSSSSCGGCESGSCDLPQSGFGGCPGGMCGLN